MTPIISTATATRKIGLPCTIQLMAGCHQLAAAGSGATAGTLSGSVTEDPV